MNLFFNNNTRIVVLLTTNTNREQIINSYFDYVIAVYNDMTEREYWPYFNVACCDRI